MSSLIKTDVDGRTISNASSAAPSGLVGVTSKKVLVALEDLSRVTLCAMLVIMLIPLMLAISRFAVLVARSFGVNVTSSTPASVWRRAG